MDGGRRMTTRGYDRWWHFDVSMRNEKSDYDTDWSIYDVSNTQVALKHITLLPTFPKTAYANSLLLWNASRKKKMNRILRHSIEA